MAETAFGDCYDCYDNAMAESFFATLECELLAYQPFPTQLAARTALFEYIEVFYNRRAPNGGARLSLARRV